MTPADAAELLTLAAAFDRRTVGEADARAWAAALNSMPLDDDAREAVARHYSETSDWLTPAHVRAVRSRIRGARLEHANVLYDGRPDETPAQFLARRRTLTRAVADGRIDPQTATQAVGRAPSTAPLALTGGPAPEVVERLAAIGRTIPAEAAQQLAPVRRVRAERESLAAHGQPDPLDVPCPYDACRAEAGQPCRQTGRSRGRRTAPHPSRIDDATARHNTPTEKAT